MSLLVFRKSSPFGRCSPRGLKKHSLCTFQPNVPFSSTLQLPYAETLRFYRSALKNLKKFPPAERNYYKHHLKMNIISHADEREPERLKDMLEKGKTAAHWVSVKYLKE